MQCKILPSEDKILAVIKPGECLLATHIAARLAYGASMRCLRDLLDSMVENGRLTVQLERGARYYKRKPAVMNPDWNGLGL